jgi:hypothetical protein
LAADDAAVVLHLPAWEDDHVVAAPLLQGASR